MKFLIKGRLGPVHAISLIYDKIDNDDDEVIS